MYTVRVRIVLFLHAMAYMLLAFGYAFSDVSQAMVAFLTLAHLFRE